MHLSSKESLYDPKMLIKSGLYTLIKHGVDVDIKSDAENPIKPVRDTINTVTQEVLGRRNETVVTRH